ncbi:hypothetical protein [Moraxella bovoculi]|uniref:hypothetical protein n=1 Tax=Moraxella bovoculi TaxID=386891 RepID=UPI000E35BE9D|nr:hypothetical protein [Moraxella bovoculi]AXR99073.1 hypothetical protein AAX10_10305 [Moraxella bovoculi]
MTDETDEILHTIKRMVRQSLYDMEMDKQRFENEKLGRQAHISKMQAQLDAEAEERKARIAKMQAEQEKIIKETKLYPWVALLIVILAICGTIFKLLQS